MKNQTIQSAFEEYINPINYRGFKTRIEKMKLEEKKTTPPPTTTPPQTTKSSLFGESTTQSQIQTKRQTTKSSLFGESEVVTNPTQSEVKPTKQIEESNVIIIDDVSIKDDGDEESEVSGEVSDF